MERGERRSCNQILFRWALAIVALQNNVRPRLVLNVKPEIVGSRDSKRNLRIFDRRSPDVNAGAARCVELEGFAPARCWTPDRDAAARIQRRNRIRRVIEL
jgi:hypothetical protein